MVEHELDLFDFFTHKKEYSYSWETKKCNSNKDIQKILNKSSKKDSGHIGRPDLIYCNNNEKFLILLENKDSIKNHQSKDFNKINPQKYSVDGVKHYLSFFLKEKLDESTKHISSWKILGLAFSGDIKDKYNKRIDTFYIYNDKIVDADIHELLNEDEYLSLFSNLNLERISSEISKSSKLINEKLRSTEISNRSILLSALLISLLNRKSNDFRENYKNLNADTICDTIPLTIKKILKEEVREEKVDILINQLSFLKTDIDLRNKNVLKEILDELKDNVIPLFEKSHNYDIVGKFYSEFLRYAGVTDVKKGIVLTPQHITSLFSCLVSSLDLSPKDVIFDPCCGTGSFLISGMNEIISIIDSSGFSVEEKKKKKDNLKTKQLIGFEKNSTMYSLAMSNMLFRGDGKSNIYNLDFFSKEADDILNKMKPTIGFMNPPYGGKDNDKNPTKKEIHFLEQMLDKVTKYGIIIAPISTYFKDKDIRERILLKHSLKYIIHMPPDLFQPNAATSTVIGVFETQKPHNNKEVVFYDLKDDGFVLSKNKGRTDRYNKWNNIKSELIKKLMHPENYPDDPNLLKTRISEKDEWLIHAHMKTNYNNLSDIDFLNAIKEKVIFNIKKDLNILDKNINLITLLELLNKNLNFEKANSFENNTISTKQWNEFLIGGKEGLFTIEKGKETIVNLLENPTGHPLIGASKYNNGYIGTYEGYKKLFKGNTLTVSSNGTVGKAFYQEDDFIATGDINILSLKNHKLNKYIASFLCTIIEQESFRYNWGRKWGKERMEKSKIKLPIDSKGNPDFNFMEKYIKSLPYSNKL